MQSIHMYQGYLGVNVENKELIYNLCTCIKDILVSTSKTKNSNRQPLCVKHLPCTVMFITLQKDLTKIQLNYVNSHRYLMTIIAVFHLRGDFKGFQRFYSMVAILFSWRGELTHFLTERSKISQPNLIKFIQVVLQKKNKMQRVYGQTDKRKQSNAKSEHMLHVIR